MYPHYFSTAGACLGLSRLRLGRGPSTGREKLKHVDLEAFAEPREGGGEVRLG